MPMPRAITRFNRAFLNRVLAPAAGRLPAFGVVLHRGRKSGRAYRTPVNIFKQPNGYVIALTYGIGDWVHNILAAGECVLVTQGRSYRMTRPRLVHDERRRAVPAVFRAVGALANVSDFVYLSYETPPPTTRARGSTRVPSFVRFFNPVAKLVLAAGVPLGPDVLLTVRGRKSGLPRSTPVAVAEIDGRLWLVSPWGEVDWARNLRAAGRATITSGRRKEEVTAIALGRAETVEFYRTVLNPYLRAHPFARWIVRHLDGIPEDPVEAAEERLVFEVRRGSSPDATRP